MEYFTHLLYGALLSYIGFIYPGMLNMTALKIRISNNKNASIKFAAGASFIIFIQAGIALLFADYFMKHPIVIENLRIAAIVVLFILSVVFFILARRDTNFKESKQKSKFFMKGVGMSAINMVGIPFYLGMSVYLASINKIVIKHPFIFLFVLGAAIGAFLIFYTYIYFAKFITNKVSFVAKNINYILCALFFTLAVITWLKTYYS
ncbi:MAG TPA: hypothetical protein VJ970_05640 [Flavobacteriaceae bacterium]|nr:hypothetical protein [Flavobacteriaceae bacterium]